MQREKRITEERRRDIHERSKRAGIHRVAELSGIKPSYLRVMYSAYGGVIERHAEAIEAALKKLEAGAV